MSTDTVRLFSGNWFRRHGGTLQLAFVAFSFGLALVNESWLFYTDRHHLGVVLALEFVVLVIGFLSGMLVVPAALSNRMPVKMICLAFSLLLMSQMVWYTREEYGAGIALVLLWLAYAHFGSAFFTYGSRDTQFRLALELGMRWLVYLVLFMSLPVIFDLPVQVEYWGRKQGGLWMGLVYFGGIAFLEWRRFFPRNVSRLVYLMNSPRSLSIPRYRIRLDGKDIKGHAVRKSTTQNWYWILLLSLVVLAMIISFTTASETIGSWTGRILLWLFLLPFVLIGLGLLASSIMLGYQNLRLPASRLSLDRNALGEGRLSAVASFPGFYSENSDAAASFACYRIFGPGDDSDVRTAAKVLEVPIGNAQLIRKSREELLMQIDESLPERAPGDAEKPVERTVWQLQIEVTSRNEHSGREQSWVAGFVLPLEIPGNSGSTRSVAGQGLAN